jgi:hypothetical protein
MSHIALHKEPTNVIINSMSKHAGLNYIYSKFVNWHKLKCRPATVCGLQAAEQ